MTALAVVVPARDEEPSVARCLGSVLRSLDATGLPSQVVVVAHHCTDGTATRARQALGARGTVIDSSAAHVSGARRAGVAAALQHFGHLLPQDIWLLSTDADTVVPVDWVQRLIGHALRRGAVAVAGMAELDSWHGMPAAGRTAYLQLIGAGTDGETHRHAYAANLAVRADAYLAVGGWPRVVHGEEHALLDTLAVSGLPVHRPTDVVVTTSGRRRARAAGGLGDLLGRLARAAEPDELSAS